MNKALQRELKLFFLIPKNIYLPISVFGIIFVDNQSDDSSFDIVKTYDSKIKYFKK